MVVGGGDGGGDGGGSSGVCGKQIFAVSVRARVFAVAAPLKRNLKEP